MNFFRQRILMQIHWILLPSFCNIKDVGKGVIFVFGTTDLEFGVQIYLTKWGDICLGDICSQNICTYKNCFTSRNTICHLKTPDLELGVDLTLMEDNLILMEHNLQWNMIFNGRYIRWKMTFNERQPLMEPSWEPSPWFIIIL